MEALQCKLKQNDKVNLLTLHRDPRAYMFVGMILGAIACSVEGKSTQDDLDHRSHLAKA
jgi:hypothetical protein